MNQKIFVGITLALAIGVIIFNRTQDTMLLDEISQIKENTDQEMTSTDNDPVWGEENAPLQMVIFSNFQCPHCASLNTTILKLQADWIDTGKLSVQFRDFPISKLVNSLSAHVAASAADKQGKYFEYHHRLYEEQEDWRSLKSPEDYFMDLAKEFELDVDQFEEDYNDESLIAEITADRDAGRNVGMTGTPGLVINDKYYQGAIQYEELLEELEETLRNNQ